MKNKILKILLLSVISLLFLIGVFVFGFIMASAFNSDVISFLLNDDFSFLMKSHYASIVFTILIILVIFTEFILGTYKEILKCLEKIINGN